MTARIATREPVRTAGRTVRLPIAGMDCASCAMKIEKTLRAVPGVDGAAVNFAAEEATVALAPGAAPDLAAAVENLGYRVRQRDVELSIEGMHCASCVQRVESGLARKEPAAHSLVVSFSTTGGVAPSRRRQRPRCR